MDSENLEKYVEVFISEDKMSADIFLSSEAGSETFDVDELIRFAQKRDIVLGIKKKVLEEAVNEKKYGELITFAWGRPAEEGKDGYFDYKFDINAKKKSGKPAILEDGTVDYRNLKLIECVEAGQIIAEYFPKEDGTDGFTVTGDILATPPKRDLQPLRGKGFEISEDGRIYTALIDGRPEMNFGRLEINNVYMLSGDVSLSTGNINFKGDLEISGSIKSGMTVEATGNITVNGSIEASVVKAGKSILVKGGMMGGSKAHIEANEDIIALFIENATVQAGHDVMADALVNCNLYAGHDVIVTKKTSKNERAGTIIGGVLTGNHQITAYTIGSTVGIKTDLRVGISYKTRKEYYSFKQSLTEAQRELEKIEKAIEMLEMKQGNGGSLMLQLVKTKIDKAAYVYKYKEICAKIEKNMEEGKDASVTAMSRMYPGVIIRIDGIGAVAVEEYRSIIFKRKGDKVVTQKYMADSDDIKI